MNAEMKNQVINLLETYAERTRKIALLRYELEHPGQITEDELLAAITLSGPKDESGIRGSGVSDKTMRIAMSYRETAQRLNSAVILEIRRDLQALEWEIDRLNFYMEFLTKEEQGILRLYYFEKRPWSRIEKETGLSRRTLVRRRSDAIDRLTQMYAYTGAYREK